MAKGRIWNLRMNLDELNGLAARAYSDQDKAQAFIGILLGCNGTELPDGAAKILRDGFEVGQRWRAEAESFSERKASSGRRSAEVRAEKHGTAQPNTVRGNIEHCSNTVREIVEPIHNPQSTLKDKESDSSSPAENLSPLCSMPKSEEPPPTSSAPRKKRTSRPDKIAHLDGYPDGALLVVRTLLPDWPTERDGSKVEFDPDRSASRVTSILEGNPSVTPELLIAAANRYLDDLRQKGSMKYCSALHFFFGKGKGDEPPKWAEQIRAIRHAEKGKQND